MRARLDYFVLVTAVVLATSCGSGGGCGGCATEPIPGGFPAAKRNANAAQLRVSDTGLAAIQSNPAAIIGALAGGGSGDVQFVVPSSCGGSTPICCPGGNPVANCGPIDIDLNLQPGDDPRLVLAPKSGSSELDVTVRARVKTLTDIPVKVPIAGDCTIAVDTTVVKTPGTDFPDIQIDLPIQFVQDATAGTTRIQVGTVALTRLTADDVKLNGGFACQIASLGLSFFLSTLTSTLTSTIQSTIQDQTCKACPGGSADECGGFATACTGNVCMEGTGSAAQCLQELGLDGRIRASALFSSLSPGTTGALDLYEVTGGYATSDNGGLALGLLGGMEPGGAPRDRCGPAGVEPTAPSIAESAFFQGNTRPDNGSAFDVAIGVHASQLAQFAFAGYDGGLLCLTVGHDTVSQLSTDTIGLLARSLTHLVETSSPVAVGLRPQSAPTITLGTNTYDATGALVDPLLDLKFTAMEIDFFAAIDDQYVRVFTVVSDVHLPIGLQVSGTGTLTPVLGSVTDAFTNVSVKNSDAVTEAPADLAALFPQLLGLVVPQLSAGLSPISLPSIGGLNLSVTDVTAVDNKQFLAIFANLAVPSFAPKVHTQADILGVTEPADAIMKSPRLWKTSTPPSVQLALGGTGQGRAADLEWQLKLDGGFWQPWSRDARPTVQPATFWLPGVHHIEIRARQLGHPETMDDRTITLEVPFGDGPEATTLRRAKNPGAADFHGQGDGQGCQCDGGGSGAAAQGGLLMLIVGLLLLPRKWTRRMSKTVLVAAIAVLPGCSCGGTKADCGPVACIDGDVPHGAIGRFTSIAGDDQRVMVATYDQGLGDLVAVDATDPTNLAITAVDGIPAGVTPTHDPSGYRGGIDDPGPNVGAYTSIVLSNHTARIAYQDRDAFALKYAYETATGGPWQSYVIDAGSGEQVGEYASLAIDAAQNPAIAYLGVGVDDGSGHRVTELRVARASSSDPTLDSDWTSALIASGPGSCAGLCGASQSCVAATATDPETCIAPTADCTATCSDTQVCSSGSCVDAVPDPTVDEPPGGTGLYVSLVALADGRLAAAYHDNARRALILAVEDAANSNTFTETVLVMADTVDAGYWASAAVATDGTVHVAYQDAIADETMYVTWNNGTVGTPEVVDDGERTGDRTHPVGASASLFLVADVPQIAYQDGLTADVYLATRAGGTWATTAVATGPVLDGFSIAGTAAHGSPVLAWESITPAAVVPGDLVVQPQ